MPDRDATPVALPEREGVMSFWGHRIRGGPWHVPRRYRAVAWMGGVTIDLSEAVLPPEGADLELFAFMGVITVLVPPHIAVRFVGDAITGSLDEESDELGSSAAIRGLVRIRGRAVLGKVHLRLFGRRSEPFALS